MKHSEIELVIQGVQNYKEKVNKVLNGEEELKNIKPVLCEGWHKGKNKRCWVE